MKLHGWKVSLVCMLLVFPLCASGSELEEKVRNYLEAKEAAQQAASTKEDVESMLAFVTDDFRGQHPRFNVSDCESRGGKARFRAGLLHHLESYESTKIEILEMMEGLNAVAVEFDETVVYERDGEMIEETDRKMFVFEFEDGLISVERRYY